MGLELNYINGQTPVDEEEKEGLKIKTISTRGELDEFEQQNIENAVEWSLKNRIKLEKILTEEFILSLHTRMFKDVWKWAGKYRKTDKNIGVDKYQIVIELRNLIYDVRFWIENQTFDEDEIAVRFSHRIVKIHLFPNGNGRHSRLIGDILVNHGFGKPTFTWGAKNLVKQSNTREMYISALREADLGDYKKLIEFARS